MEEWTTIRFLHAQGKSARAIAKELGISRNTVHAALRKENPPKYSRPPRPNPKLEPFLDQIKQMFVEKKFIGSRILRELEKLGYQGGSTALYTYLRAVKAAQPDPRLTMRFETPPGHQAQFDWSPYTVSIGNAVVKVSVFCLTLGYSRRKFYWPSLNESQVSIFEALEVSLRYFGGCPKQLLVDNAGSFVTNAHPEHFQWNTHFLELCGHYAIQPVACAPYRARTKGKVERPFFYLEQHLIKGGAWENFDALTHDLARFSAEELDHLVHSTTGERPIDRFQKEKDLLTPLPALPFVGTHEEMRKVSWDCFVSFRGSSYAVPPEYAGKHVWLRPSQGTRFLIRNQKGQEIVQHDIAQQKGSIVVYPSHYEKLKKSLPKTRVVLEEAFLRQFPDHQSFVRGIFIQHKPNGVDHLRGILRLVEFYPREALLSAFNKAEELNSYSHKFVRALLESSAGPQQRQLTLAGFQDQTTTSDLSSNLAAETSSAALAVYQRILEAGR